MQFFDPLVQLILDQTRTPEEAARLAAKVATVDWNAMFTLKAHCEDEIARLQLSQGEDATSEGVCQLCQVHLAKADMAAHLLPCLRRQEELRARARSKMQPKFLILVEGSDLPVYWGYVEVSQESRLSALDAILRRTWVECCGHLSAFTIGDRRYESHDDPEEDWDPSSSDHMRVELSRVLRSGVVFMYEYDFGSSTYLTLRVLEQYERKTFKGKSPSLLARNVPPVILCSFCGQPATRVCTQCREMDTLGGRGWYCGRCAREHECGTEPLLPVVNSPRVGVCGYTGKAYRETPDDFSDW